MRRSRAQHKIRLLRGGFCYATFALHSKTLTLRVRPVSMYGLPHAGSTETYSKHGNRADGGNNRNTLRPVALIPSTPPIRPHFDIEPNSNFVLKHLSVITLGKGFSRCRGCLAAFYLPRPKTAL